MDRPRLEMVFFDIGGVMYDDSIYARSWMTALRESGAVFTDEEFDREYAEARAAQSASFRRVLTTRFLGSDDHLAEVEARAARYWAYPPDSLYPDVVPQVAPKLKAAGVRSVVLAGNPAANEAAWRAAGVDRFIFIKCDVLATLREMLREEGVLT